MKLIRCIAGFCFFVLCGCASLTSAQKKCIEDQSATQALVTVEEAIACSGDKNCIYDSAKQRWLITVEYAKTCIEGSHD